MEQTQKLQSKQETNSLSSKAKKAPQTQQNTLDTFLFSGSTAKSIENKEKANVEANKSTSPSNKDLLLNKKRTRNSEEKNNSHNNRNNKNKIKNANGISAVKENASEGPNIEVNLIHTSNKKTKKSNQNKCTICQKDRNLFYCNKCLIYFHYMCYQNANKIEENKSRFCDNCYELYSKNKKNKKDPLNNNITNKSNNNNDLKESENNKSNNKLNQNTSDGLNEPTTKKAKKKNEKSKQFYTYYNINNRKKGSRVS